VSSFFLSEEASPAFRIARGERRFTRLRGFAEQTYASVSFLSYGMNLSFELLTATALHLLNTFEQIQTRSTFGNSFLKRTKKQCGPYMLRQGERLRSGRVHYTLRKEKLMEQLEIAWWPEKATRVLYRVH